MDKLKVLLTLYCCAVVAEAKLQQVQVILRHGDRNPDRFSIYPTDPHRNDTYYPDGFGHLTKLGKQQIYKIGLTLRKRYNGFLGNIYTPDLMEARSTWSPRAKESLELVLAGLWPPGESQIWNSDLPWLPIPYTSYPSKDDVILRFPLVNCPKYIKLYNKVEQLDKYQYWFIKNENTIKYINESTQLNVTRAMQLGVLYSYLFAEESTGHQIPEWTKKVYPEFLKEAQLLWNEIQTANDGLLSAIGARMVEKALDDAYALITGEPIPKIFIYAAHDFNILHILAALKVYQPHVVPYAAYILIELHKINGQYGFKIFYQDYSTKYPRLLQIPNCEEFCLVEKYEELFKQIFIGDDPDC